MRGLSHIQNGPEKRHFIYNPKLIFGVLFYFLIRSIVLLRTSGDVNRRLITVLADFGYCFKIPLVVNVICIIANLIGMSTIIIYWLNNKKGIIPTFLRVFDMICGQISPKDIGVTAEAQVVSLVRRAGVMFKAIRILILWLGIERRPTLNALSKALQCFSSKRAIRPPPPNACVTSHLGAFQSPVIEL